MISPISLIFSWVGLTSDFFAAIVSLPQVLFGLLLLIGGAGSLRLLTDEGFGKKLLFMSFQVISFALGLIFCIISAYRIISEIIPQEEETA